jgi:hypothetical protein
LKADEGGKAGLRGWFLIIGEAMTEIGARDKEKTLMPSTRRRRYAPAGTS